MNEHERIIENIGDKLGFEPQILHTVAQLDPDFLQTYHKCDKRMLSDGALPAKMKVLMALVFITSGAPGVASCREALKLVK